MNLDELRKLCNAIANSPDKVTDAQLADAVVGIREIVDAAKAADVTSELIANLGDLKSVRDVVVGAQSTRAEAASAAQSQRDDLIGAFDTPAQSAADDAAQRGGEGGADTATDTATTDTPVETPADRRIRFSGRDRRGTQGVRASPAHRADRLHPPRAGHDGKRSSWPTRPSCRCSPSCSPVSAGLRRPQGLFVMRVAVGFVDLLFALESSPAVSGVTDPAHIVLVADAFALLGMRALCVMVTVASLVRTRRDPAATTHAGSLHGAAGVDEER